MNFEVFGNVDKLYLQCLRVLYRGLIYSNKYGSLKYLECSVSCIKQTPTTLPVVSA